MQSTVVFMLSFLFIQGFITAGCIGLGGVKDLTKEEIANDKLLSVVLSEATSEYNKRVNSMYRYHPLEVLKASKQIVAGVNYEATVEMAPTECLNNEDNLHATLKECPFASKNHGTNQICHFKMWYQAYLEPSKRLELTFDPLKDCKAHKA